MLEIRHVSRGEISTAYDKIYRTTGIHRERAFLIWLLSLLQPEAGSTFLDVACGQGELALQAAQIGLRAYGVDYSPIALRRGKMLTAQVAWAVADGEWLPCRDNYFDYVASIGSLEHYEHPQRGMVEIWRVLKLTGKAIILLPNSFGLMWNIQHVLWTGDIYDDGQPLQRYATIGEWKRMLEQSSLEIVQIHGYDRVFPRTWADLWRRIRQPKQILATLIAPFIPLNLAGCFVFICRKGKA